MAQACPAQLPELAARFRLKAVLAATEQHQDVPEAATALATLQTVLSKAALTRQHFDVLVNYAADLVQALSASGTPARKQLAQATDTALQSLAANTSLSQGDRLAAMQARVALLKLDLAPGATAHFSPAVLAQVRAAAKLADQHAKTPYERQALIPNAAELLSDAGLLAESDQMLLAELPKAEAPYYHMLVLASNAQERGDTAKALDWAEKAWTTSQGAATRLQWGSGYVARLLELSPQDTARISQAASQVLAEVPATPDTFYERNRRSLEKMAQRLNKWATSEARAKLVQQLSTQWNATCGQLPEADPARAACAAVFPSAASKTGA